MELLNSPLHGSSGSYSNLSYKKIGHWSPETTSSPLRNFSLILQRISAWEIQHQRDGRTQNQTSLSLRDKEEHQSVRDENRDRLCCCVQEEDEKAAQEGQSSQGWHLLNFWYHRT